MHFISHHISSHLISISNHVPLINYDVDRGIECPSLRSMVIRIDLAQLGFSYHMTYVGLGPDPNLHISTLTQILQNLNQCTLPESTVPHLSMPPLVDLIGMCTYLLSPSPTPSV
jgi:hypothetical protein